ncbi:MAG: chromosome segregation protein SMC [Epulopiscium sp. Nuni2H_MBin001]|nr:MAG: chromosome segregation protein SMC [Epulopiscium sp. Nuni2H_MBin001]
MYLDKVELHGFKSFGDRVKLNIPKGITAVIGPNGSGKSNVADAIRWVLGEQSAKLLRGAKMEDVIFAGTEARKPLGYAEVSLYILNDDESLGIAFKEIVVKRRIYRSGESEYFLNNSPCRLRDIQELFMDTGVGKEGYSIIGQGQIDKVLSSKPDDRRNLFEEAAGIYKYKIKRLEAEKKLVKEQENIARVNDIILEIETRLEPLEAEAAKTKQYLEYRDTIRKIDINLFIEETRRLDLELSNLDITSDNLNSEYKQQLDFKEALTQKEYHIKNKLMALRHQVEEASNNILELEKLKAQKLSDIKVNEEKVNTARTFMKQLESDANKRAKYIVEAQNEIIELNCKIEKLKLEHTTTEQLLAEESQKLEDFKLSHKNQKVELERVKHDIFNKLREIDILKSDIEKNLTLDDNLSSRYDVVKASVAKLNNDISHQEIALRAVLHEKVHLDECLIKNNIDFYDATIIKGELEKEFKDIEDEYNSSVINKEDTQRKLKWLKQVKNDYEGYYQSVKKVLKLNQPGLRGIVADLIEVEVKYEIAILTALGAGMQNIVANTESDAKQTIDIMKKRGIAKVTFLPIDTIRPATLPREYDELSKQSGFLGLGSEVVRCQVEFRDIVSYLLGKVVVVDTMDSGSKIAKLFHYRYRIVTLDGESFNVGGSLSGGSNKTATNNIFSRSRELKECESKLQLYNKTIVTLLDKKDVLSERLNVFNIKWNELSTIKENAQSRLLELASEEKLLLDKLEFNKNNQLQLVNERNSIEEDREEIDLLIEETKGREIELRKQVEQAQEESFCLEQRAKDFDKELENFSAIITQFKLDIVKSEQAMEHAKQSIEALAKQLEEAKGQDKDLLEKYLSDEREYTLAIEFIYNELESLELDLRHKVECKVSLEEEINTIYNEEDTEQLIAVNERISNLEKESIRLEGRSQAILDEKHRINQHIWDEYELTAGACTLFEEHLESIAKMKSTQDGLRAQIKLLGNVNVNAIDEFKQVSDRHNFLVTQKTDILNAQQMLQQLVETLTNEMNTIFKEQFKHIAKNFSDIFQELFGGGSAFLKLTDEDNVLESGIEMIVKPPGKKLQNMMLLSGGERALTAIALLFGILKLKPSPFCVLDEIEAALDDANVIRFVTYLKGLSTSTQFIVITHRKGTMENADTLYGVTQQEQGISTVLGISFDDANKYLEK